MREISFPRVMISMSVCLWTSKYAWPSVMFTTLELTVLVLGILLLLLALIYKFCNWFTRRKSEEVVVDGREAERADQGREEIFNVSSRFREIVSIDLFQLQLERNTGRDQIMKIIQKFLISDQHPLLKPQFITNVRIRNHHGLFIYQAKPSRDIFFQTAGVTRTLRDSQQEETNLRRLLRTPCWR